MTPSLQLTEIVHALQSLLRVPELPDYPTALNGLQLENRQGSVTKVAAAVDATLPVIEKAVAEGADLLLVHHGMYWNGLQACTGPLFRKLSLAMEKGLAIYSAHLPLDVHPTLGNNARLMRALGLEPSGSFLDFKGLAVGLTCEAARPIEELQQNLQQALEGGRVHLCAGGPKVSRKIGLCTGGAGAEVAAAAKAGVDTFITGEGPHWSYTLAEELGINVLYGGHYATETFGVRALAQYVEETFHLPWVWIDHPTGL